uniref:FHF complex subunit HOOK-interacting protein C-terminal domain-containing protein n=1 Tax=Lygus hesperus TaxID=30085 RepID=A0A0A9Y5N7_LYGHE
MLLVSLPDSRAAEVIVSDTLLLSRLTARMCDLYHSIPITTEPGAVDEMHVSWGLDMASAECLSVEGSRQLASFLAWYDFCDQVSAEAHPIIGHSLVREIVEKFLSEVFTDDVLSQPLAITILGKLFKVASSSLLNKALSEWLVGESITREALNSKKTTTLQTLLSNWSCQRTDLVLETLRFFEVVLEKGNAHVMKALILIYLDDGSFLDSSVTAGLSNEEENETTRITRVVNSFVNLVPVGLRSTENGGYEQYLSESQRQYSTVLTSLKKQGIDPYSVPPHSAPHERQNGKRRELFYEGPFLRTLFNALGNIPYQPYEINLELTGIVSKVCLRPEHFLSLYLVESSLVRFVPEANSLHSVLHRVATLLASAVMARPDYEVCLKATRLRLITDQTIQSPVEDNKWITTFENIVVIEELCKELAAIAYIKNKHRLSLT